MNLAELQKKLVSAARRQAPDERVPYAFEKRIQSLIAARPAPDLWAVWARGLWRAAISCVVLVLLLGIASLFTPPVTAADTGLDLSQAFENTLLASADQSDNLVP
jgi:hypothetical protein